MRNRESLAVCEEGLKVDPNNKDIAKIKKEVGCMFVPLDRFVEWLIS